MTQKTFVSVLTLTGLMLLSIYGSSRALSDVKANLDVQIDTTPLPITELYPFNGELNSEGIILHWTLMGNFLPSSDHYFELEHAKEDVQFSTIAVLDEDSNSHLHQSPSKGKNYYRLRVIEDNGQHEYSDIILLQWDITANIFPNPVTTKTTLQIDSPVRESAELKVYDSNGRLVYSGNVELYPSNNLIRLDCSDWQHGPLACHASALAS